VDFVSAPRRVAYSFVIADMLHYGHIRLLESGRREADYHICGVISDEACTMWQGPGICSYQERSSVIASLSLVDEVIKQNSIDPTVNLKYIRECYPDAEIILIHGNDWKELPGSQYLKSIGGRLVQPEYYERLSRQSIINRILDMSGENVEGAPAQGAGVKAGLVDNFFVGDVFTYAPEDHKGLLSTKADTLRNFKSRLKTCMIEKLFSFEVGDYMKDQDSVLDSIMSNFSGSKTVVRSSSLSEDLKEFSGAGCFESVIGVDASNREEMKAAIKHVLDSYERLRCSALSNQVLVQRQTVDVRMSGVVFTRKLQTNTPYYYINYDNETGETDSVTGGRNSKSVSILRNLPIEEVPDIWRPLIRSIREIEDFLPGMVLDIEFAQKRSDEEIVIFQIRPLAANIRFQGSGDRKYYNSIDEIMKRYRMMGSPFLSDMAFWNPSEIIGDNPHPLDYSLYFEIITRRAWNVGLRPLGYRAVSKDLMVRLGNKPYIDLQHSFASLTPAALSASLYRKLSVFYREELLSDLASHDKIEFDIVLNAYFFTLEERLALLAERDFTPSEINQIRTALAALTSKTIRNHASSLEVHSRSLKSLEETVNIVKTNTRIADFRSCIKGALRILRELPSKGTVPFAAVAREAFMAAAIGRSLVDAGYINRTELEAFMSSISTVTSRFDSDFHKTMHGKMDIKKFFQCYGHLRAGTYDINAPRYDTMELDIIRRDASSKEAASTSTGLNPIALKRAIDASPLSEVSPKSLVSFIRSSTQAREQFKFEFTKALSFAIELIAHAGEALGFSRKEICFLQVQDLRASMHYGSTAQVTDFFSALIKVRKRRFEDYSHIALPPVICFEGDLCVVEDYAVKPNFTTSRSVSGEIVDLEANPDASIKGKIVLLKKADPGFDWIFTQGIKGLITKYGGAASHMSIRCAEFNIPAAIGCGETLYARLLSYGTIKLDCKHKKIQPMVCVN